MRILTRYVLREFLVPVGYCALAFTMIYVLFELFDKFDRIVTNRPPLLTLLGYLAGFIAPLVQWLLPASLLLGGLYAMWQLARHSEIIAMRASGIGFGAIIAPLLIAAGMLSLLSALSSEFYVPEASRQSRRLAKTRFASDAGEKRLDVPFNNYADSRVWRIGMLDPANSRRLEKVRVTQEGPGGLPQRVLTGEHAEYLDGVWWFFSPFVTLYDAAGNVALHQPTALARRSVLAMPAFGEQPRDFVLETTPDNRDQENLSLRDMIRYVRVRPRLPHSIQVARRFDIHYRLAAPWACVVITLFAVPAGVASGRQSVFRGVVTAIGMFFAYYAVTQICMVLAKKEFVPVPLGAWLPNALFLVAGIVLFVRQR